jgi:co-chaperonin GroES (HSP10)
MATYWPLWPWIKELPQKILGDRVLTRVLEPPSLSKGGVALPFEQDEHYTISDRCVVELLGNEVTEETRAHLKVGDIVLHKPISGDDYQRGPDHILVLRVNEILAILESKDGDPCWDW